MLGTGKPVVVLNMTGSAMDLRYMEEKADAVMQVWYPGARGGRVVAQALFGELSPSGKLPVTFYNDSSELPAFEDYSMKDRTYRYFTGKVLYPFGYGLTYGDVAVEQAECGGSVFTVDAAGEVEADVTKPVTVRVKAVNHGKTATGEVLQAYIKAEESPFAEPNAKLCAFARISLGASEDAEAELVIPPEAFTVVDEEGRRTEGGRRYSVSVGLGQPDERTAQLTGRQCVTFKIVRK